MHGDPGCSWAGSSAHLRAWIGRIFVRDSLAIEDVIEPLTTVDAQAHDVEVFWSDLVVAESKALLGEVEKKLGDLIAGG